MLQLKIDQRLDDIQSISCKGCPLDNAGNGTAKKWQDFPKPFRREWVRKSREVDKGQFRQHELAELVQFGLGQITRAAPKGSPPGPKPCFSHSQEVESGNVMAR
jgi:hypothetical protein